MLDDRPDDPKALADGEINTELLRTGKIKTFRQLGKLGIFRKIVERSSHYS